jgi:hypothetical protein
MFDDLSYYPRYNRIVGSIGLPWFNCPGNHDMNLEAPDDTRSRDTYIRIFGARNVAFQVGETTFFALDNVEYLGTDPARPNGYGKYRGCFHDQQLAFDAKTRELIALLMRSKRQPETGHSIAWVPVEAADQVSAAAHRLQRPSRWPLKKRRAVVSMAWGSQSCGRWKRPGQSFSRRKLATHYNITL